MRTASALIFETTADGSPTARFIAASSSGAAVAAEDFPLPGTCIRQRSEAMHSLNGAFSETLYVYGRAIEVGLANGLTPKILSIGLGLGYVEILACGLLLKHYGGAPVGGATAIDALEGCSFEINEFLRNQFASWAKTCASRDFAGPFEDVRWEEAAAVDLAQPDEDHVHHSLAKVYNHILFRTAAHLEIEPKHLARMIDSVFRHRAWDLKASFSLSEIQGRRFSVVCFDAFSSKSTPDLWQEVFLKEFLASHADPKCVFATYACTGALKRALREAQFELHDRMGYASKRDSTFATRGLPPIDLAVDGPR